MRTPLRIALAVGAVALGAAALGAAGATASGETRCTTVDGAPAATSEALVLGMRRQMAAQDEAGLRKFLDTGQALLLRGGNSVTVLDRRPERGTVVVRREGAGQLPFWTLAAGIVCSAAEAPLSKP